MERFKGVFPPMVTLFKEDGIDYEACEKQADFLIEKGATGLAFLGTSGEFCLLTQKEKIEFITHMVNYVKDRVPTLVGAGSTCLADTKEILKVAEEVGATGALVVNPYYMTYEDRMVEAWYGAVAESTRLPLVIYNFPGCTGYSVPAAVVKNLAAKYENIVGIKETVADADHIRSMMSVREADPDFTVFVAYDDMLLQGLKDGCDGIINATVNFSPELTAGLYRTYFSGDAQGAEEYQKKILKAMEVYPLSTPLFLACKEAVYQRVLKRTCTERLPGLPLSEENKQKVTDILKTLELI